MRVRIRFKGGLLVELGHARFTSNRNAHAHLFKHVYRLHDTQAPDAATQQEDPERWHQLFPNLKKGLVERRQDALRRLRTIPGCAIGNQGPTLGSLCGGCDDGAASREVDKEFAKEILQYSQEALKAFVRSLRTPDEKKRLVTANRSRQSIDLYAIDSRRRIVTIGTIGQEEDIRWITVYRLGKGIDLKKKWTQLARRAAGNREGNDLRITGVEIDED